MEDTFWKLIMVGDFQDCPSCDEPCGYVWFVRAEFDVKTQLPVCINTRKTEKGVVLCPADNEFWTPKASARSTVKSQIQDFVKASEGPLYKLNDFCKGGAYENAITERNIIHNERIKHLGIDIDEPNVPDKILWPNREDT